MYELNKYKTLQELNKSETEKFMHCFNVVKAENNPHFLFKNKFKKEKLFLELNSRA